MSSGGPVPPEAAGAIADGRGLPAIEMLAEVSSTNDVARARAEEGAPHGTTVLADRQTAGRGRQGRGWHSPPGVGVWLSVVLRPAAPCAALLSLRAGMAAARALAPFAGPAELSLKWPNDLLISGRKVAGVLCEAVWEGDAARFVIAGVGVNVLQSEDDFPVEIRPLSTSLAAASGRAPERLEVAAALAAALAGLTGLDAPRLSTAEMGALTALDALRGTPVRVEGGAQPLEGTALGIAPGGALLLRDAAGRLHEVTNGSVRLAGPARAG